MKARIRRISASVDTALSPTSTTTTTTQTSSSSTSDACINMGTTGVGTSASLSSGGDLNSSTEIFSSSSHSAVAGYNNNPSSKSLDICVPESRIERMRKLLSSPLLKRKTASQHGQLCCSQHQHHHQHHHHQHQHPHYQHQHVKQLPPPSSSSSSSPSSSPALSSTNNNNAASMKTFGVSLESLSHHQHPHHQQYGSQYHQQQLCQEDYYVRDPEQIVVPHQKAAHILGQVCPGCLTSAPSNSSSTGSINDTTNTCTTTTSGHFSPHGNPIDDLNSSLLSIVASPSSGNSSSSTTSSTASSTCAPNVPCLIPYIVTRLCSYIENSGGMVQEGLFRISGNAKLVDKLKQSFDQNGDAPLETEGDLAAAAALLKQFLRELPQPLIPNGSQFLDVIRSLKNDRQTCVLSLKALVSQLPDENYYTLRYLIRFLHRISQRNEENRMTSTNLGIVFAPNIFRVCVDTYQGLKDQSAANEVVNLLISDYCEIFNETNDSSSSGGGANASNCRHSVETDPGSLMDISYDSIEHPQCQCSMLDSIAHQQKQIQECNKYCENLVFNIDESEHPHHHQQQQHLSTDNNNNMETSIEQETQPDSIENEEMKLNLDKKRKSYQKNKNHRTIEEYNNEDLQVNDDDNDHRCQSFDLGKNLDSKNQHQPHQYYYHHHHHHHHHNRGHQPQRCNSEEMYSSSQKYTDTATKIPPSLSQSSSTSSASTSATNSGTTMNRFGLKSNDSYHKNSHSHEIIITNSSDSVSTDDNTTTATTTGPTICSVIIGVDKIDICNNQSSGGDVTDVSEDNLGCSGQSKDYSNKFLTCGDHLSSTMEMKGARSSSCGSDCTENINIPTSLSFTSDDDVVDDEDVNDDEDSLLKSIASECTDNDGEGSDSSSSSKSDIIEEINPIDDSKPQSKTIIADFQEQNLQLKNTNNERATNSDENNNNNNNKPCSSTIEDSEFEVQPSKLSKHVNLGEIITTNQDVDVNISNERKEEEVATTSASSFEQGTTENDKKQFDDNDPNGKLPDHNDSMNLKDQPQQLTKKASKESVALSTSSSFKIKSRNRRLQSIRRKIKQFEIDFEQENGYEATFENKMVSSFARPLMLELSTLLEIDSKNLKDLHLDQMKFDELTKKTDSSTSLNSSTTVTNTQQSTSRSHAWKYNPNNNPQQEHVYTTEDIFNTIFGNRREKSLSRISEMMQEIQRTLNEKRYIAQRPESLDLMNPEQIYDEKLALQKALLRFEALCGRPSSKAERDIVRPVYDRYRLVKRYATKFSSKQIIPNKMMVDVNNELQPILENVQMNFTSPTHQNKSSENDQTTIMVSSTSDDTVTSENKMMDLSQDSSSQQVCDTTTNAKDKNYHIMSRYELLQHLQENRQQKRNLRSVLRTFENDFYKKTGRRVEKEDRSNMSSVYTCYKNTKGRIRLIEALISKKIPKDK